MGKTVRLGYMGIPLSNSEAIAKEFVRELNWDDCVEYVALMSSKNTVDALFKGEIDYGVVAVRNSSAGEVKETKESLEGKTYRKILEGSERIHHCLFVKSEGCGIEKICSHVQALGQCKNNLAEAYPEAELIACSDTAYAAEMLSEGKLPDNCAVLCRKEAGEFYGLRLEKENIEDRGDNETFFFLIAL